MNKLLQPIGLLFLTFLGTMLIFASHPDISFLVDVSSPEYKVHLETKPILKELSH
jgi:hypothetical protein